MTQTVSDSQFSFPVQIVLSLVQELSLIQIRAERKDLDYNSMEMREK